MNINLRIQLLQEDSRRAWMLKNCVYLQWPPQSTWASRLQSFKPNSGEIMSQSTTAITKVIPDKSDFQSIVDIIFITEGKEKGSLDESEMLL